MIYSSFSLFEVSKSTVKTLHALCHGLSFLCAILAMWAVHDHAICNNLPQFQSFHSWMGMATLTLFFLQLVFGAVMFLCPCVSTGSEKSIPCETAKTLNFLGKTMFFIKNILRAASFSRPFYELQCILLCGASFTEVSKTIPFRSEISIKFSKF